MQTIEESLYYLEIKCLRDLDFPNVSYKTGTILYYNTRTTSNEAYIFNYKNPGQGKELKDKYRSYSNNSYLPFVRNQRNAKKWKIRKYPERIMRWFNIYFSGDFQAEIKEIHFKITTEE